MSTSDKSILGKLSSYGYPAAGKKSGTTLGDHSAAEGQENTVTGDASHAEGVLNTVDGDYSHAEGYRCTASSSCAHAEGLHCSATLPSAHAEGSYTAASNTDAHAEGNYATASGNCAHAEGSYTTASGNYSHAGGRYTVADRDCQTAIGTYNATVTSQSSGWFIVGKGTGDSARANCFRVASTGVYGAGAYSSSGADYAEMFEWADGNLESEDRCGRFVTLAGGKIRLAGAGDDFILGIVSGMPSCVGDSHDDQWQGMFLTDVFGRPVFEDVEVPAETREIDGETVVIREAHTERRQKLNPEYDGTKAYKGRSERPEWDAVGVLGKLVALDDGTCVPDGWARPGEGGIATAADGRTHYRVMERIDGTHVRLLVL